MNATMTNEEGAVQREAVAQVVEIAQAEFDEHTPQDDPSTRRACLQAFDHPLQGR